MVADDGDKRQPVPVNALYGAECVVEHPAMHGNVVAVALHQVAHLEDKRGVLPDGRSRCAEKRRHPLAPHFGVAHVFGEMPLVTLLRGAAKIVGVVEPAVRGIEVRIAEKRDGIGGSAAGRSALGASRNSGGDGSCGEREERAPRQTGAGAKRHVVHVFHSITSLAATAS